MIWTNGPLVVGESSWAGTTVTGQHGISVAWFGTGYARGADGYYEIGQDEAHANAKLYAAAPDLVDALKIALIELNACASQLAALGFISKDGGSVKRAQEASRAALAKAGA